VGRPDYLPVLFSRCRISSATLIGSFAFIDASNAEAPDFLKNLFRRIQLRGVGRQEDPGKAHRWARWDRHTQSGSGPGWSARIRRRPEQKTTNRKKQKDLADGDSLPQFHLDAHFRFRLHLGVVLNGSVGKRYGIEGTRARSRGPRSPRRHGYIVTLIALKPSSAQQQRFEC